MHWASRQRADPAFIKIEELKDWLTLSDDRFFQLLKLAFGKPTGTTSSYQDPLTRISQINWQLNLMDIGNIDSLMNKVQECYDYPSNPMGLSQEILDGYAGILLEKIKFSPNGRAFALKVQEESKTQPSQHSLNALQQFFMNTLYVFQTFQTAKAVVESFGYGISTPANKILKQPSASANQSTSSLTTPQQQSLSCKGCGRTHTGNCRLSTHPDYNSSQVPWRHSINGKKWLAKGEHFLPTNKTLSGEVWRNPTILPQGKDLQSDLNLLATLSQINDLDLVDGLILTPEPIAIKFLIDTGALQGNYLSLELAKRLPPPDGTKVTVKSALNKVGTVVSIGNIVIKLSFFNEVINSDEIVDITVTILDIPFDLIIGKPTIKAIDLLTKVHTQFWGEPDVSGIEENGDIVHLFHQSHKSLLATQILATLQERDDLLTWEDDDDDIDITTNTSLNITNSDITRSNIPEQIHGSDSLKERITSLCYQYEEIFSRDVRPTPADVPPMTLDVNLTMWHRNSNRAPPRPLSVEKQLELRKQIEKLIKLKIIDRSNAPYYSQVLLVPKPDNKWRFCLDFRNLNDCTNVPIPNIEQLVNRIGSQSAKYFGIMDLTSGYHQAPLAEDARQYTAFICFMGVFQWTRVAMGLKGAPSYFQQALSTVVLAGLLYAACELYLDDVIVFGSTEDDFVYRLSQVFERFKKYTM
jgi:hypothetical protein